MEFDKLKIIVVGDGFVGKTCLLRRLETGEWVETPGKTIGMDVTGLLFNAYFKVNNRLQSKSLIYQMRDYGGQVSYLPLLAKDYVIPDGLVLAFSLNDELLTGIKRIKEDFQPIIERWSRYIDLPIALVGLKADLPHTVPQYIIKNLVERLKEIGSGSVAYFEVSAKVFKNIYHPVEYITKEILKRAGYDLQRLTRPIENISRHLPSILCPDPPNPCVQEFIDNRHEKETSFSPVELNQLFNKLGIEYNFDNTITDLANRILKLREQLL